MHSKLIRVGIIAAIITSFQYWLYIRGIIWPLPLSTTNWGVGGSITGWYPLSAGGRILGPFYDPNMTGTYFSFLTCLILPMITNEKEKIKQWFYILALFFVFMAMFGSGSRQALVVTLVIIFVHYTPIIRRQSPIKLIALISIFIISVKYSTSYIDTIVTDAVNNPYKGDLISRFAFGIQITDDNSRLFYIRRLLDSLDSSVFLFGTGEGTGEWGAHNAYLITLQEDGLFAFILLVFASLFMLIKSFSRSVKHSIHLKFNYIENAPYLIVLTWIGVITLNWSQLNQAFPWVFLVFVVIFTDGHLSYRFNELSKLFPRIIKQPK